MEGNLSEIQEWANFKPPGFNLLLSPDSSSLTNYIKKKLGFLAFVKGCVSISVSFSVLCLCVMVSKFVSVCLDMEIRTPEGNKAFQGDWATLVYQPFNLVLKQEVTATVSKTKPSSCPPCLTSLPLSSLSPPPHPSCLRTPTSNWTDPKYGPLCIR
jgi:hypothetical protein